MRKRKIAQYTLEGEFIRTFDSATEAAISLNKEGRCGDIVSVCRFIQTQAFGFRWLYAEDMAHAKEIFKERPVHVSKPHTFEEILETVVGCRTKSDFLKKNRALYFYADKHGWLDKLEFERALNPYKENCYTVYAIPFYETNTIYVGLTDNLKKRWERHLNTNVKRISGALKYSLKTGIPMPDYPLIIEENLYAVEALYFEDFWRNWYKSQGMNVLNKAKTGVGSGSLGGVAKRSNKEVFDAAGKCETLTEFHKRFQSEYRIAIERNLLDKLSLKRTQVKKGTYTEEYCYNFMRQFKTMKEAYETNQNLYFAARDKKWLKQYWWLYKSSVRPVIKTTGFKIKIYSSPKSCHKKNGLKLSTLFSTIKSGKPRNGSHYHYLDINDIEFDIPDFEHRYII